MHDDFEDGAEHFGRLALGVVSLQGAPRRAGMSRASHVLVRSEWCGTHGAGHICCVGHMVRDAHSSSPPAGDLMRSDPISSEEESVDYPVCGTGLNRVARAGGAAA